MIYSEMLFLVRRCTFQTYRHCKHAIKQVKSPEVYLSPFPNLSGERKIFKLFSTETNLTATDAVIQRYLNLITDAYENNHQNNEIVTEILNLHMVPMLLNEKMKVTEDMKSLKDLVTGDEEMKKLAKEEESMYKQQLLQIDEKLLDVILENLGKEIYENVLIEITPGVGGQEAMLFAKDLFDMYIGYLNYLEFSHDVIEADATEHNGIRKASILVSSVKAFEKLRYEGGIHRVQRIPATEKSGRLHTSTASVAILPEPRDIEVTLNEKDLKIETKRASGAGGQHVNTTDSAVRITHIPSGTVVTCQSGRSQIKNREWAFLKLKTILYEQQLDKQTTQISSLRRKQMGMRQRNEKIRTYNYNQDRITDHRIPNGTMYNLKDFLKGGSALEELEGRLHKDMQQKILLEIIQKMESQLK